LTVLALAMGLWYLALPPSAASDIGFGALVAWALLGNWLAGVYPPPYAHVEIAILGKLAVFQSAVLALMVARRAPETGYGFVPTLREWRIGALHFLCFIPVGLPLALGLHAARFAKPAPLWVIVGTFLGFLWVVGLAEEFLFRGVLQPMLEQAVRSQAAGLALTSLIFGLAHLWFRGFPNWRWVLVAGTLGWFCGHARDQAGGIRAAVVTHALTVTAWRAFFA
jgi:membrane protease YdiL (CAAX protease family)